MTSSTSGSKIEWYLARDGRQHGPLAESEMMKFLELGHLRPGDLVWRAGFTEWRPASTIFDLSDKTIAGRQAQPTAATVIPATTVATPIAAVAREVAEPDPGLDAKQTGEPAATAESAVKTGLGAKRPLDTPLLSPAQLQPIATAITQPVARQDASAPATTASAEPADALASETLAVTSLNERLQRAASERVTALAVTPPNEPALGPAAQGNANGRIGATQPLHKSWPNEPQIAATVAISPTATKTPNATRLTPLPEVRAPNPVPLMPLGPRGAGAPGAATASTTDPSAPPAPKPKRKKEPRPELSGTANSPPSRGYGRLLGIGVTLAIIVGGGGWLAYTSARNPTALGKPSVGLAAEVPKSAAVPQSTAVVVASGGSTSAAPPAKIASATTSAADGVGKTTPFVTAAKTAELIDADLKRSALWQLIASEFPEWHRDRVNELAKLAAEKRDATTVSRHIAEALVSLRRKFADQALSASPERLRAVAIAFLDNLRQLSAQSTDACYGFISQGETYPAVIDLMRQGDRTEALHKQSVAVFEAVAFGRKTPQTNLPPRKVDYDMLATELTARGWSQSDLQMFSDAKALAAAPPEQVCKMVQDWFAAQIAIKDPAVQLRLLIESLRPVVAG
jgi:GYF domain 2